jgi:LytS/YehU family sensor histidine kinase
MATIKKETLYWICQFGGWFIFTILEVISYLNLDGFRPGLVLNGFVNFTLGIILTHTYRMILIRTGWLNLPLYKMIPRGIIALIVMSSIITFVNIPLDRYTYPILEQIPFTFGLIFIYFMNLSKYVLLWSLTYHLFQYWERLLEAEKERYRLQAAMKENAYHNLKAQLNPHFLFNSLNSIRTLIDQNPQIAKSAITQLSGLLRSSLYHGRQKTISLKDEIQTVNDYLAIESIRFDERLVTHFNIEEEATDCQIPPMMLQTLIENAVKHGISKSKNGGEITLNVHKNNKALHIDILNTGHYNPKPDSDGLGIENTKERLQLLYEEKAIFNIENEGINKVHTHIEIPLHT